MGNTMKRFLALALALFMVIGMMPTNIASATEAVACDHTYVEGKCELCGETQPEAEPSEELSEEPSEDDGIDSQAEDEGQAAEQKEQAPARPTATVSDAERAGAAFAVYFTADTMTSEQQDYYGSWKVDLVLTVNKALTMNNLYPSEYSYLSIYCPALLKYNGWVDMPGGQENVNIPANTPWGLLAFGNMPVTYDEFAQVGNVGYAAIFQQAYLEANPGLEATVSLVLTNPENGETITVASHKYVSDVKLPDLPGATVSPADVNPDIPLTFAKKFTAETPSDEQAAYYGSYYADFVLTVNKDVTFNADSETADGYLAGEYGEYGWIKVPVSDVTLKANESLKIMEYAAEMKGEPGLQMTYAEIYKSVKTFNCGAYFTPEFLAANPDFEVSLELRLYESNTDSVGKVIGDTFTFTAEDVAAPELPGATVIDTPASELGENVTLTFAKKFTAVEPSEEQAAYYDSYYADFVLTVNKDVTLNAASETADGYLSGEYGEYGWVNVPVEDVTLKAGEPLRIMEYAAGMLNQPGLQMTYKEIYESVKTFNCGAYFTPEFLAANPDFEVSLELRLYETKDDTEGKVIGETFEFTASDKPALPTATVSDIVNKEMTFAKNFKVDPVTAAQLAYYGDWYADFELTINQEVTFDANGGEDGYLSGQYDGWSDNSDDWYNVPPQSVTLKANESLKIMEYAAELLGEPGLKYTYKEVYESVKDFDCGVFFEPAFLLDLEEELVVTLELRMYNPADESESYTIGETYTYTVPVAPKLPTATVTDVDKDDLTFAKNFKADEITDEQLAYYGNWYADFELTINKDVTFDANGTADGYLSGQYDGWSEISDDWFNVPLTPVTLKANEPLKIMEYAATLMGEPGLKYTYKEVYEFVKDFDCGVFFEPEFLEANPDLEVTLELKMYHPQDETTGYVIGETYVFENNFVAYNKQTQKLYSDVSDAMEAAAADQTVILLRNAEDGMVSVLEGTTLDLNGYTLTANYVTCFGDLVDNSEANTGVLKVSDDRFMIREDNAQLPIWNGEGYQFVEVTGFNTRLLEDGRYVFQPLFEPYAHELLLKGAETSRVTINVRVSWKQKDGVRHQDFVYNDAMVSQVISSYGENENGKYGKMFTLSLTGTENFDELTYNVVVVSKIGAEKSSD